MISLSMASILRSSKFVRYIAGFAKNVVVNTPREFDGNFVNTSQCFCGVLPRNLATQTSTLTDQNLESSLRKIDQDVRKSGRISRRDIEDVLEEIRTARSATTSQSLLVIRCCGNLVPEELPETRTKLVQEIWNTLNKLNVPMDVSHFNALLRVYLENEHPFSPTEFLSELEKKGIEPNRVTYQRLIARYCQVGDIEGATKILEFMREKQMSVNENVFNALIIGHSNTGDMESAQGILKVMMQTGLEPSADTYTTLLCGYASKGDIDKIREIIEECDKKEIYLLDKDYLDVIYSLATNHYNDHIPTILTKVRKNVGYNQDAVNLTLRLVNKGLEDAAFTVLKSMTRITREDSAPVPTGMFFIKQLVKAERPIEKIIEFCKCMETEGMYDRAFVLATETSLQLGNDKLAYPLLEELNKNGVQIKQHFFWPLMVAKSNDTTGEGVISVLKKMDEFSIHPTTETLKEYVIPNLKGSSSEIIAKLREGNVSVGLSASSLVICLLQKNEIREAAAIAPTVPAYYNPDQIRKALTGAYYKTKDIKSYITLLRAVYENVDRKANYSQNFDENEAESVFTLDKASLVGSFILDLATHKAQFLESIEEVLCALTDQGLSISNSTAEIIEDKLSEKMTNTISDLLGKLTSGELTPVAVEKKPPVYVPYLQMTIPQLERLILNLSAKNEETKGLKRHLMTLYYRAKDLKKMEALVNELQHDPKFIFTSGLYAQMLDLYAHHNDLDKALEYYEKLKENQKQLSLDDSKIIKLAQLYIQSGKLEEAINVLENTPREKKTEDRSYSFNSLVWRMLNTLAEEGAVEPLNKIFQVLLAKEFIEVNNVILGPLVKVHLVRKELDEALAKFEWCVNQYKATPWKNELACQLIQGEDAEKLQKLTDLSTFVHGEVNSLYDLVFAFVECGRVRQARKILETPGLQNRPRRINYACERYQQEGLIKPLENLKDATKDLHHIDRSDIYHQLLLSYKKQDDPERALSLWTQMQEEDLPPSQDFLKILGKFLTEKGHAVPFVIPENEPQMPLTRPPVSNSSATTFRHHLRTGNLKEALDLKRHTKDKFSVTDLSSLIEKLVQENHIHEASDLAMEILDRGNMPVSRVFRFLLNKLANVGDVDTLDKFSSKVTHDYKKIVSFDNRVCHANLVAGKADEYLEKLQRDIETADDQHLSYISEQFPRGGAYGILEKYPELTEKYENMAIKYAQKGIVGPLNVLWTYSFIHGNDPKAEQLWSEYLRDSPRIMFQKVVQTARDKHDEVLANKLIEHLKISKVTEGAIGNAYSCLLDVVISKGNHEELVRTFEQAIKDVPIQYINRTAILRTKEVYEKLGKQFDHVVPPKNSKNYVQSSEEL